MENKPYSTDEKGDFSLTTNKDRKMITKLISYYHIITDKKIL